MKQSAHGKSLTVSILSLSLLTVMAGAAVAPALGVIQAHFSSSNQLFIQMIISVPALFIVITNFIFPRLCRVFGAKTLVMIGLLLYTVGGCAAGLFDNIFVVLIMRAFVGIGVGIIMPLSTGLLSYYYSPEEQAGLMGYSSAMNQMGGVVATLLSGLLANISWRVSFLVYLMGLISIVLCLIYLPNDKITQEGPAEKESGGEGTAGDISRQHRIYSGHVPADVHILYLSGKLCNGNGSRRDYSAELHCGDYGVYGFYCILRRSAVCKCQEGSWRKYKIPGSGMLPGRISAAGSCRRMGRHADRICIHWICQWCGNSVYYDRGIHESRKSGSDYGYAVNFSGPVSGTVCFTGLNVYCKDDFR